MKNLLLSIVLLIAGCGDGTAFKGSQDKKTASSSPIFHEPQSVQSLPQSSQQNIAQPQPILSSLPPNAIQKGSFAAYTEPTNPRPREPYTIVIIVSLPPHIMMYDKSDLSGRIIGTDNYIQGIGINAGMMPSYGGHAFEDFLYAPPTATLRVGVPGAENLVRDTIEIRSNILNESQVLTLQFGGQNYPSPVFPDSLYPIFPY